MAKSLLIHSGLYLLICYVFGLNTTAEYVLLVMVVWPNIALWLAGRVIDLPFHALAIVASRFGRSRGPRP